MPDAKSILNSPHTLVMGILNLTPDSFYDGGRYADPDAALKQARRMVDEGADIIDIGGESTRPGSDPVPLDEELRRVVPIVRKVKEGLKTLVSIDTYKSEVARRALDAGADIVNDISGVRFDPDMPGLLKSRGCPVVVMHMKGTPKDMQQNPHYDDVVGEVREYFDERVDALCGLGIDRSRVILDPGIGFGKRVEDNLALMARLEDLRVDGLPLLVGASRKSVIGAVLDLPLEERLEGTLALTALAVAKGVKIIRVHDVKENVRVVRMVEAVKGYQGDAKGGGG